MKKRIYVIFLISLINISCQETDIDILEKTVTELNSIESVLYTSILEAKESELTYAESEDSIFIDFSSSTKNTTPKYFIKNKDAELIFDGKKCIQSLVKEKIIVTDDSLGNPNNPLMLTLYPIRELLPKLINNENIKISRKNDTLLDGQDNYIFEFLLKDSSIDWFNLKIDTLSKVDSQYTLTINKSDYLPRKIVMSNDETGTLSRTSTNFDFKYQFDDQLWTGALLPSEYKSITFEDYYNSMMKNRGSQSKEELKNIKNQRIGAWKIPNLENDSLVDFSKFRGNVVLLEFWFKYCGPCVKAVPQLNAIKEKYKNEEFLIYGIEFREDFAKENLQEYVSKIEMKYPVLYKGENLASEHSIQSAPTFMILDKKGNIIYLESGFHQNKIEEIIKENL